MKTSNIIAIILLLTVSILPTFVSAEALFIDTPFQEMEFDQNRPLPKVWTVCYPSCDDENKIDVNLMNKGENFFSIEQLQFIEEESPDNEEHCTS